MKKQVIVDEAGEVRLDILKRLGPEPRVRRNAQRILASKLRDEQARKPARTGPYPTATWI